MGPISYFIFHFSFKRGPFYISDTCVIKCSVTWRPPTFNTSVASWNCRCYHFEIIVKLSRNWWWWCWWWRWYWRWWRWWDWCALSLVCPTATQPSKASPKTNTSPPCHCWWLRWWWWRSRTSFKIAMMNWGVCVLKLGVDRTFCPHRAWKLLTLFSHCLWASFTERPKHWNLTWFLIL